MNYLRIRGEKTATVGRCDESKELPPHTRRKAISSRTRSNLRWNYLRIRGEKGTALQPVPVGWELPPHTRRKVGESIGEHFLPGTTSAYAEKRNRLHLEPLEQRNYLRIRGEKTYFPPTHHGGKELPPHTRRKEPTVLVLSRRAGTTSAYAEKSADMTPAQRFEWNYLRIRGEKSQIP
ncbi:Uncharacterised protein [Corynebacterium ulcerans]|nr:Uncharacterised protein [Corynebacterium ulcerans]SQH03503.1 Uncharacterised protein [Corynebacterium ulcerans]